MNNEVIRPEQIQTIQPVEGIPMPTHEEDGNAYAWGKTARILTEAQLLRAMGNTTGRFLAADICSAYTIFRQI